MARIILKSPYLKPSHRSHIENYIRYIATRDGVEPVPDSTAHRLATRRQQEYICSLLRKYPDLRELYEYEDYQKQPTRKNAVELILRSAETHGELLGGRENYIRYMAGRPGVEKLSSHGLFSDEGQAISLSAAVKQVSACRNNIWTHIISLRREDAERLGYQSAADWMQLLRSHRNTFACQMKIPPEHFCWYAAFHNESHHPHVHMIAFSSVPGEGHLSKQGILKIKAELAKDIFRQDLISTYQKQTEYRDQLRRESREEIARIATRISSETFSHGEIERLLKELALRLSRTKGKKVYGYLKADVKALVNRIVDKLEEIPPLAELYRLWYQEREAVIRTYTEQIPSRLPLSENKEFKSIRNAVIREAMSLLETQPSEEAAGGQTALCVTRLLRQVAAVIRQGLPKENSLSRTERKERSKQTEKRRSHGLRDG